MEDGLQLIKKLRKDHDIKAEDLLNKKELSEFELDLIMNQI
jgi:hypothetical protein